MIEAIVLGLVQGLGEFLPISSSGHLVITPWLFGWDDPGLGFSVALHIGTLIAVVLYFRWDLWHMVQGFIRSLIPSTRDITGNIYQKLPWLIGVATIPGAIAGLLLEQYAETVFRSPLLVAGTLAIIGLVLYAADYYGAKDKNLSHISWKQAFIIGFAQAAAIVPGVSRSGATITAALAIGLARPDAARFSFLLSVPIIVAAGVANITHFSDGVTTMQLISGMATAAISGYFAIKYLLKYVQQRSFLVFTVYRLALAVVIVGLFLSR